MSETIIKVHEKNCYPAQDGVCVHKCTVSNKIMGTEKLTDKLMTSEEIFKKLDTESSMHIKNMHTVKEGLKE